MNRIHLTDDMLLYLAKYYITERDCLALALSGVSERFTQLYGSNRRRLVIGRSYFLTADSWKDLQHHISSDSVIVLDISNCYWIPAEALCLPITEMVNLEELSIQDTQISLAHLPEIFGACQKIVKFSFTLGDTNQEKFRKELRRSVRCVKQGFSRLVHLKIFIFTYYYSESWLVLLEMLGWCRDCVELFIMCADSQNPEVHKTLESDKLEEIARKKFFPNLKWMKKLQTLVLLGIEDFFDFFLEWQIEERKGLSNNVLERMWFNDPKVVFPLRWMDQLGELHGTSVKSLMSWELKELKEERFHHLEHVSDVTFQEFSHLPNLKYVSGDIRCGNNFKGLNEFCKSHPKLEHLLVKTFKFSGNAHQNFGDGDWSLLSLKVLSYSWTNNEPSQLSNNERVLEHIINVSPNIEELHVNCYGPNINRFNFSKIQLQHLTGFNLIGSTLGDGSYLPLIVENCRKLERLQLRQSDNRRICNVVTNLAKCLPKAANLRDLRLQWSHVCKENVDYLSVLFKALLKCSSHLERLVILDRCCGEYDERTDCSCGLDNLLLKADYLVSFVAKMGHLVAFCLAGVRIDLNFAEIVKQRLITDEILPLRPALWFHLGQDVPHKVGDPCAPRIHYDEILQPLEPHEVSPIS